MLGIGGLILYFAGGYASFDPSQQGRQHRAQITPGMTWREVVAVNPPKKWRILTKKAEKIGPQELETMVPGPLNPFDADRLASRLTDGSVPEGFQFEYVYSSSVAFAVQFDAEEG